MNPVVDQFMRTSANLHLSDDQDPAFYREWMLIFLGVVTLLITLSPQISSDGELRYQALTAMVYGAGSVDIKFSLVQPVLSIPLAMSAKWFHLAPRTIVPYYNVIIFLLGALFSYKLLSVRYTPHVARLTLLLLGCGSMVPHHLQLYFGEVTTSVFLFLGLLNVERRPLISTLLISLAVVNTPALIPALFVVCVLACLQRSTWVPVVALFMSSLLVLMENYLKYGDLFSGNPYFSNAENGFRTVMPYSGLPGFSYPLFFGLISILFSFGKGLLFYIPGVCLVFWPRVRDAVKSNDTTWILVLAFCSVVLLVYSKWWAWYGGGFWGPRFFLFLCFPVSLLMALAIEEPVVTVWQTVLLFGVLMLSVWGSIDGYVFGQSQMDVCWENQFALEALCWYTPEFSALWRPFVTGQVVAEWDNPRAIFAYWQLICAIYTAFIILRNALEAVARRRISPDK